MSGQRAEKAETSAVPNRPPLQPAAFLPLPLGTIRPQGWLLRQLQVQASGLTGHLDEFWKDVGSTSGWLGGSGESWERGPYYLDGLLPLAYELDDATLKEKSQRWVEWTLTHQQPNGQFGPPSNDDWWPRMVMLKVLSQYAEATGDARVVPLMTRYFQFELKELPGRPLRDWGKYRWQDNLYSVLWLYNRTGDQQLLQLANLLRSQGYDWEAQFANFKYTTKQTAAALGLKPHKMLGDAAMQTHGVNNAMALKTAPLWWLVSGEQRDRAALNRQLAELDRYHGLPNGMFSADEHLAGRDPSQGIELCAVVEAMFSYEQAFAVLGDPRLADRLERVAYNALPATLSNDMWSHQYDQQPNQIACTRVKRQWSSNGDDSNLFGLEPNFGCCTANFHQGWPKFAASLWMATPDGGLLAAAYAPNTVHTQISGAGVTIEETTDYPFRGSVELKLSADRPVAFPLLLRLPGWADTAALTVNGEPAKTWTRSDAQNGFIRLNRQWAPGDTLRLEFPMQPRVSYWYANSAVFERGPLVFALPLREEWQPLKKYNDRSADWQVISTDPWNFTLDLGSCPAEVKEQPLADTPFDVHHPAVTMQVRGRPFEPWNAAENSAGPPPPSPVRSKAEAQPLTLVPYGAAKLRITAFPYSNRRRGCWAEPAHHPPDGPGHG